MGTILVNTVEDWEPLTILTEDEYMHVEGFMPEVRVSFCLYYQNYFIVIPI